MERPELFLELWGAILSTALVAERVLRSLRKLVLVAYWSKDDDELHIEVTNVSSRPVTITLLDLAYGQNPKEAVELFRVSTEDTLLADGQLTRFRVSRSSLVVRRNEAGVQLQAKSLIWLRARMGGFGRASRAISIDPKEIGASNEYPPVTPYIAVGLFLDFPPEEIAKKNMASFGEVYSK